MGIGSYRTIVEGFRRVSPPFNSPVSPLEVEGSGANVFKSSMVLASMRSDYALSGGVSSRLQATEITLARPVKQRNRGTGGRSD